MKRYNNKMPPTCYQVTIEQNLPLQNPKVITSTLDQDKLDETLGRYLRLYGTPIDASTGKTDIKIFNYYKRTQLGEYELSITFSKIDNTAKVEQPTFPILPKEEPKPLPPQPEPIKSLLEKELIEPTTTWNRKYYD